MTVLTTRPAAALLPSLRKELEIIEGSPQHSGAPAWIIHDPLQNRYFQISNETHQILKLWCEGLSTQTLAATANAKLDFDVTEGDVTDLHNFLLANGLLCPANNQSWTNLANQSKAREKSILSKLLHSYLFFKIPLFHPQAALERAVPFVEPLYSRRFLTLIFLTGITGLYLAARQWEEFLGTFQDHFSWTGLMAFTITLGITKTLHELGHALTAVRAGCRVPTMGIAFMLLAPMLYTDVTDAWRLTSRRQRLLIHGAGIMVELALASIATLAWVFLPDGAVRSCAFTVATASWVISLAVNLNPLMRFDGYYLFSDFIRIDNLQSRANALGQWKLREILFSPGHAPPEELEKRWQNGLIAFAWASWVYRLILFTGIALLVYHYFFKALGIILFAVEIWYFIVRPVLSELAAWPTMLARSASKRRAAMTCAALCAALLGITLPLSSHVEVSALAEAAPLIKVFPPAGAHLSVLNVKRGDAVAEGTVIARLERPEIAQEIEAAKIRLGLTRLRLARVTGDQKDREARIVLLEEETALRSRIAGLNKELAELTVRAPIAGRVVELPPDVHAGRWIGKGEYIIQIASSGRTLVRGYLSGSDLGRVALEARGTFVPDDITRASFPVTLKRIAQSGSATVEIPELAVTHGGSVAALSTESGALTPVSAQFGIEFDTQEAGLSADQTIRGTVSMEASSVSLLGNLWRQVSRVLVRESGF